jgi:hypothetical protein
MTSPLAMSWQAFSLPKRDHSAQEYEDAFAGDGRGGRFAVADGASESSFSGLWARLLAKRFVKKPPEPITGWADWLPAVQQRWSKELNGKELPWYAEDKFEQGAFATFLGLAVGESGWRAVAVGDSCLFQVRGGAVMRAFPVEHADDFGNQPRLVGSRATPAAVEQHQLRAEGDCRAGDLFLLMTDALAEWFLRRTEAGGKPWEAVERLLEEGENDFTAWVESLREDEALRNDDVTLVAVQLGST